MKEAFVDQRFRGATLDTIDTANTICAEYRRQGYNLTLRQLYYQFVSKDLIPNHDREYKKLGNAINDARLAGLMDWDYIQDRTRDVNGTFFGWDDPGRFIERHADSYYEALWDGQDYRPEVWVEKDALKDVIGQAANIYGVPYFSCRGYASQTAMYDAAKRIERRIDEGVTPVIIHLGDHDPSGIDMTRDIRERLSLMSYSQVEVRRIALNMDQVDQYQPPPNPAKITDSRAEDYIAKFGHSSWELDALEPSVLSALIVSEIETVIDLSLYREKQVHEDEQRARLVEVAERFNDLSDRWGEVEELLAS